ncbi:unnamed protein product [Lactuca virosa]|uniref:Uncharacterized protein n=1 Tax=Lactuca virosa TaxID=75947 RepID=A0AAU9LA98_9ASTR|nr:unnamed protein product [Lactuca virosa]
MDTSSTVFKPHQLNHCFSLPITDYHSLHLLCSLRVYHILIYSHFRPFSKLHNFFSDHLTTTTTTLDAAFSPPPSFRAMSAGGGEGDEPDDKPPTLTASFDGLRR